MYRLRNFINSWGRGRRIWRFTLWARFRGPRFRVEDFRKYGGNSIDLTFSLRPDVHSWFNWHISYRFGGR